MLPANNDVASSVAEAALNLEEQSIVNSRPPKTQVQKRAGAPRVASFSDPPPQSPSLTDYDRRHLVLYVRLLDAAEEGADWTEVVRVVFGLDPERDGERARSLHESHLARARWVAAHGYRHLLRPALH